MNLLYLLFFKDTLKGETFAIETFASSKNPKNWEINFCEIFCGHKLLLMKAKTIMFSLFYGKNWPRKQKKKNSQIFKEFMGINFHDWQKSNFLVETNLPKNRIWHRIAKSFVKIFPFKVTILSTEHRNLMPYTYVFCVYSIVELWTK